jgi:Ca2+-binding EF-hand superfamily protein
MNTKRIYAFLAVAAIAAVIIAGLAVAQSQDETGAETLPRFIQQHDEDGDGMVSLGEFTATVKDQFDRFDADGDGFIDASEAPGKRGHRGGRFLGAMMFMRFDANDDEVLSKEEFPGSDTGFDMLDADQSGTLSQEELAEGMQFVGSACHDADGDGLISKEEFSGPDAMFDRLDNNGDGFIDSDEKPHPTSRRGCRWGRGGCGLNQS